MIPRFWLEGMMLQLILTVVMLEVIEEEMF